jgi:hypothetical protein
LAIGDPMVYTHFQHSLVSSIPKFIEFFVFWVCSHWVPIEFPICSYQVPIVFLKFPMCSLKSSKIACLVLSRIVWP